MRAGALFLTILFVLGFLPSQTFAQWAGFYAPSKRAVAAATKAVPVAGGVNRLCIREILLAQMRHNIPDNLLLGIGLQESGLYRNGDLTVWPFAANAEGRGKYFETEAEAVAWVTQQQRAGITSIDVGCMQINMHWHPDAFDSVNEGFDPARNVEYAAAYLSRLYRSKGNWRDAAAAYHSGTQELGEAYLARLEKNVLVANSEYDRLRAQIGATRGGNPVRPAQMPTTGAFWTADLGGGNPGGAGGRSLFGPGDIAPILPVFSRGS